MPDIKKITAQQTFSVRHPVLRKGLPIESCRFDGDDLATTHHFGLFEKNALIGVISVFEMANLLFDSTNQAQIRGMAVLENHQGNGYGSDLVRYVEQFLQQQTTDLIWFNARENAVRFYKKMGYEIIGNAFEIKGVGVHFVMFKVLSR